VNVCQSVGSASRGIGGGSASRQATSSYVLHGRADTESSHVARSARGERIEVQM
jgi:hypothetical protein